MRVRWRHRLRSKLKADLRKAAEGTIPRLRRWIGGLARRLTARGAANYWPLPSLWPFLNVTCK